MMPPLMFFCGLARVWRLIMLACSTVTRFFQGSTVRTRPVLPLSRPAMTLTVSPWRMVIVNFVGCFRSLIFDLVRLPNFRSERDDLGEFFVAQLSGHRPENASAHGLVGVVDQNSGIVVEADV